MEIIIHIAELIGIVIVTAVVLGGLILISSEF